MQQKIINQPNNKQQKIVSSQHKNKYKFLTALHSKYLNCKICTNLMLQPLRLHKCGHTFCYNCIGNQQIKKCPICLEQIQIKQKDILAIRLIGQMPVCCLNNGCPWKGSFQEYSNFHQDACKLTQGGIDQWLKQVQNTIDENSIGFGGSDKRFQDKNQHFEEKQNKQYKIQKTDKQLIKSNKKIEIDESEQKQNTQKKLNLKILHNDQKQDEYQIKKQIKKLSQQQY